MHHDSNGWFIQKFKFVPKLLLHGQKQLYYDTAQNMLKTWVYGCNKKTLKLQFLLAAGSFSYFLSMALYITDMHKKPNCTNKRWFKMFSVIFVVQFSAKTWYVEVAKLNSYIVTTQPDSRFIGQDILLLSKLNTLLKGSWFECQDNIIEQLLIMSGCQYSISKTVFKQWIYSRTKCVDSTQCLL